MATDSPVGVRPTSAPATPASSDQTGNRLAGETSLYLRQHKDNPVDWYPWCDAAFAVARAQDKPVLLSIGYAACHWCHVMARESFADPDTAALMNARFVNVKVDRELRPDIDRLYLRALTAMEQRGGWPLTMFLTPDGEPFWGGTYFPPQPSRGLPGFRQLLVEISDLYERERDAVGRNVSAVTAALERSSVHAAEGAVDADLAVQTAQALLSRVDTDRGGLKGAPKFPHAPIFRFLLNTWRRTGLAPFKDAVIGTLTAMSQSGLYDHLGGGYARYAVDENWTVPHFEKMLYDNAVLIDLLTAAWSANQENLFAQRVRETVGWVVRDMVTPAGAFAASLGAESEGEEGRYYLWTQAEIEAVLGTDCQVFAEAYGVSAKGQFGDRCVLHRAPMDAPRDETTERRLAKNRRRLLRARSHRVAPVRDDKILADWNGLMIAAMARAGAIFGEPDWIGAAVRAYCTVTELNRNVGKLNHAWDQGVPCGPALLDDYANLARAALALFEATGELAYLDHARAWTDVVLEEFPAEDGSFFMTPISTSDVFMRFCAAEDDATPSGNSTMLEVLARLCAISGERRYGAAADRLVRAFSAKQAEDLVSMPAFVDASQLHGRTVQVVIVGEATAQDTAALRAAAYTSACSDIVVSIVPPNRDFSSGHPAYGKVQRDGRATAYVCVGRTCSAPTTDAVELARALARPGVADQDEPLRSRNPG